MQSQHPAPPFPDITTRKAFAEALQALNTAAWSYRLLMDKCRAEGAGVDHRTIGTWFTGSNLPSPKFHHDFRVLLHYLGVDHDEVERWLATVRRLRRTRNSGDVVPYRGLDSYGVQDAPYFFGRAKLLASVLDNLREMHEAGGGAMLLVGSSGAGKTSLLEAGVRPAIAQGAVIEGSTTWAVLSFAATPSPSVQLAESLAKHLGLSSAAVAEDLRADPTRVAPYLDRVALDRPVLIIVDQVEQALIAAGDDADDELAGFLAVLQAATSRPGGGLVVLGLRADQYGVAQDNVQLRALTDGRQVAVTPMDEDELRAVIAEPARKNGIEPEAGFVELVLSEVSSRPGRAVHRAALLPQLSHALRKTWLAGNGANMTVHHYRQVGGLDRAVTDTAEAVFGELSPIQRSIARKLFFHLVLVQPTAADSRRQAFLSELSDEGQDAELYEVLYRFAHQGLLTVDAETVEITHESLIFTWPRLREWLDADRAGRLLAQRMAVDAQEWERHDRDQDHLYEGTRLHTAREWADQHSDEVPEPVRKFLDAGVRRSRRRTRRLQQVIAILSILLTAVGALTVVVVAQTSAATRQRDEAVSRMIASEITNLREVDVSLARQLALAAFRISPTVEARSALIEATAQRSAVRMRAPGGGIMYAVGIHPSGRIAAAATGNTVRFWDITMPGHPQIRPDLPNATCGKVYALAFSANGKLLAASCGDGSIHLWDTRDPMVPVALPTVAGLGAKVYSVVFSHDSSLMAAAVAEAVVNDTSAGSVRLWSVTDVELRPLGKPLHVDDDAPAKSVAFNRDNSRLAVGTDDGTVQVWDISEPDHPANPAPAPGPTKAIGQLAFSPRGDTLAAGGADQQVYLWSTAGNPVPSGPPIGGAASWVNAVAFSPDGATLAIASSDSDQGVRLLDLTSRRVTATMPHPSPVTSVKFGPDGKTVITGANDGTARMWPVASPTLEGMDYTVSAARFSPDGTTLAIGSADLRLLDVTDPEHPTLLGPATTNPDKFSGTLAFAANNRLLVEGHGKSGTLQLWDVSDRTRPNRIGPPLKAHSRQVETVAFSPDSSVLATGSRDGAVHLWNIRNPYSPARLSTPGTFNGYVNQVTFSPNGKFLVAGSVDKTVRLWDVRDPRLPTPAGTLTPSNHYVFATEFSPDGSLLAVGLADSTIRLYDVTSPGAPSPIGVPLTGPLNYVHSLAFTSDGSTLTATTAAGTVWIWDIRDRHVPVVLAKLKPARGAMYPVHYQPGTRLLVSGGDRKKAWVWNADTDAAATLICDTSGDAITIEEWKTHVPDRPYDPPCP
ncbi:AAA family ATPase [Micromonospora sp. S-DT3-3-22]|uniref:nSTAND1 domain-containing NTPase n=1 Tax=Micromonospora sp. S-DT3-3-22 TaxID=2755359 RepID=UPI0018908DF3|nr:AAA family ATPase [Micromonospora sp. S-DT3-3-22]